MSIDKLNPAAALLAAMRSDAGLRSERKGKKGAEKATSTLTPGGGPRDIAALRRQIAEITRQVDATDPDAVKAVRPRIVREILLWRFGGELREHPDWQPMMEYIVATLDSSTNNAAQLKKIISQLKR